jgi:hypothetical protein
VQGVGEDLGELFDEVIRERGSAGGLSPEAANSPGFSVGVVNEALLFVRHALRADFSHRGE